MNVGDGFPVPLHRFRIKPIRAGEPGPYGTTVKPLRRDRQHIKFKVL